MNSFYPYFAACPAFEPYRTVGSRLAGPAAGLGVVSGATKQGSKTGGGSGKGEGGERQRALVGDSGIKGRGCRRLPTRYNGDWPFLFVDGDVQVRRGFSIKYVLLNVSLAVASMCVCVFLFF